MIDSRSECSLLFRRPTYRLFDLFQFAQLLSHQDVLPCIVSIFRRGQMEICIFLKHQYEVRTSEQEISQFISFLDLLAYVQPFREVDGSYLRHADGHYGNQSMRFCFKNGQPACFDTLPAGNGAIYYILLQLGLPRNLSTQSIITRNDAKLANNAR